MKMDSASPVSLSLSVSALCPTPKTIRPLPDPLSKDDAKIINKIGHPHIKNTKTLKQNLDI